MFYDKYNTMSKYGMVGGEYSDLLNTIVSSDDSLQRVRDVARMVYFSDRQICEILSKVKLFLTGYSEFNGRDTFVNHPALPVYTPFNYIVNVEPFKFNFYRQALNNEYILPTYDFVQADLFPDINSLVSSFYFLYPSKMFVMGSGQWTWLSLYTQYFLPKQLPLDPHDPDLASKIISCVSTKSTDTSPLICNSSLILDTKEIEEKRLERYGILFADFCGIKVTLR